MKPTKYTPNSLVKNIKNPAVALEHWIVDCGPVQVRGQRSERNLFNMFINIVYNAVYYWNFWTGATSVRRKSEREGENKWIVIVFSRISLLQLLFTKPSMTILRYDILFITVRCYRLATFKWMSLKYKLYVEWIAVLFIHSIFTLVWSNEVLKFVRVNFIYFERKQETDSDCALDASR